MEELATTLRNLRRRYGAVALFSAATVLLIVLGSWWFVFIHGAISNEHRMMQQALGQMAEVQALRLRDAGDALHEGLLPDDARFEVVRVSPVLSPFAHRIDPHPLYRYPAPETLAVQPTEATLRTLSLKYESRRGMWMGEGLLLVTLLIAVVGMLYRMVAAERAFRKEMQEFLGRVTHEMKTPLAGIKAVLQTLQLGRMPEAQARELTAMALREAEREEHLIQNLLLGQRMRMSDQRLAKEETDLRALLERFVKHRSDTMVPDGASLTLECPQSLMFLGDPTAVWTILENLGDNAVKYGGRKLCVQARLEPTRAVVEFADDGIGFESERAEHLFDAFASSGGHAVSKHGTGLGLSISRTLAERMGGTLRARSAGKGQGATFVLSLPLPPRRETAARRTQASES